MSKVLGQRRYSKKSGKDFLSKRERSQRMSLVRGGQTKLELEVRTLVRKLGWKKLLFNQRALPGIPDIVSKDKGTCIFVDSDFWHGWQYPRWKHKLKTSFWRKKIEDNRRRDRRINRRLRYLGWRVVRIWEHDLNLRKENVVRRLSSI
jgi:DNA mismatch endonuclease (patch repair protein)